jgi:hypothetical protein
MYLFLWAFKITSFFLQFLLSVKYLPSSSIRKHAVLVQLACKAQKHMFMLDSESSNYIFEHLQQNSMAPIKLPQPAGQSEFMPVFRTEICGGLITVQHIQTLFTSDGCLKFTF